MVEKWLSQLEQQMMQSVKDSCKMAVQDYFSSPWRKWVLDWPGQAVICGNCVQWTAEVIDAMENRKLPVSQLIQNVILEVLPVCLAYFEFAQPQLLMLILLVSRFRRSMSAKHLCNFC
jgi:hypothetical protein